MPELTAEQLEFVEAVQLFVHSSQKAITKLTADMITLGERIDSLNATMETMLDLNEN